MGCCTVRNKQGETVRQFDASSTDECLRGAYGAYDHAQYTDGACGAICCVHHLVNYLSEQLPDDPVVVYSTWGSIDLIYDVRDLVLEQSDTGKHALALYRQHIERAGEIIERDPDMLHELLRLMLLWALFAR